MKASAEFLLALLDKITDRNAPMASLVDRTWLLLLKLSPGCLILRQSLTVKGATFTIYYLPFTL